MKKQAFIILALSLMNLCVFAQSNEEIIDLYQSVFGMAKKELVAEFISLEDYNATAFWEIYDEYEVARKALGKNRFELLELYAESYETLDDAKTDEIIQSTMTTKKKVDRLIEKYYAKIKKSVGSKPAGQFYQFENYILTAIRMEILDDIPFIGEF